MYAKTLMLIKTDLIYSSKLNKHSQTKYEQSLIWLLQKSEVQYLINQMWSLNPRVSLYKYTN